MEVGDAFDMIAGTSTGAIIAFLVGLNLESSEQAVERYDVLIEKIFTKSAFSAPMLLFTTASYDESTFMNVHTDILGDNSMLDTRANPAVPFVFAVTSKMSSTPTHVALFRNYNYIGGELPDPFLLSPDTARENLELLLKDEAKTIKEGTYPKKREIIQPAPGTVTPGSRHPVSSILKFPFYNPLNRDTKPFFLLGFRDHFVFYKNMRFGPLRPLQRSSSQLRWVVKFIAMVELLVSLALIVPKLECMPEHMNTIYSPILCLYVKYS